jgi:hypothetical protein
MGLTRGISAQVSTQGFLFGRRIKLRKSLNATARRLLGAMAAQQREEDKVERISSQGQRSYQGAKETSGDVLAYSLREKRQRLCSK